MINKIFLVERSKTANLRPIAAGFDIATIDATRELGGAAGREDAGLLHPVFPFDPAFEIEHAAHALDVLRRPVGDLLVGGNLHRVQTLFNQDADTTDPLQILRRPGTYHSVVRTHAIGSLGTRLRI